MIEAAFKNEPSIGRAIFYSGSKGTVKMARDSGFVLFNFL